MKDKRKPSYRVVEKKTNPNTNEKEYHVEKNENMMSYYSFWIFKACFTTLEQAQLYILKLSNYENSSNVVWEY